MCGLIWLRKKNGGRASKMAIKRYHAQSSRGKQGFGYIAVRDGFVTGVERFTEEDAFLKALKNEDADEILIHHRSPTSTANFIDTTHPVVVDDKFFACKYYLAHNGVLQNEHGLKRDHEERGLEYNTQFTKHTTIKFKSGNSTDQTTETGGFLDSEALAKEFALFIEGYKDVIGAVGSIAFMCYQTDQEGRILNFYYGHNADRELVIEQVTQRKGKKKNKNKDGDYTAIKSQGNGVPIPANKLFRVSYPEYEFHKRECAIGSVTWRQPAGYRAPTTSFNNLLPRSVPLGIESPRRELVWNERTGVHEEATEETTITMDDMMLDIESKAQEHELKKELQDIEEALIRDSADLDLCRAELKRAKSDNDKALCMQMIHDALDELKKTRARRVEIEITLRNLYEGIESPYVSEITSRRLI